MDECGDVVEEGVRRKSGMEPIAVEIVRNRRRPSHPELMHTACPILGLVSASYPSSVHGYSTTIMASMFKLEYLCANLGVGNVCDMVAYIYTGFPLQRSAYDGLCGPRMMPLVAPLVAPQVSLVSPRDLESYIESFIGAGVDITMMLRDPAGPAAVQADGKGGVEGREEHEPTMTGYETLDSAALDFLASDRDDSDDNPFAKTIRIPGLDVASGEPDRDECGSATSASLATPVDGVGSKRMWSQPPLQHDQEHVFIAKKLKTVSPSSPSSPPSPPPRLGYERKCWSAQEDECIMVYYEKHGAKWRDMARVLAAETLSSRSDDALRNRHYRLTAHRDESSSTASSESYSSTSTTSKPLPKRVAWTVAEDELIRKLMSKFEARFSWQRAADLLPGRTAHAIRNRANRLFMESERTRIVKTLPLDEPPLVDVRLKLSRK